MLNVHCWAGNHRTATRILRQRVLPWNRGNDAGWRSVAGIETLLLADLPGKRK